MNQFDARAERGALWCALVLLAVYTGDRLLFYRSGGLFHASPIESAKQYLDVSLLTGDLLRSLWYLHSQPPLFNAFLGLVLKVSPLPDLSFQILFLTAGALMPVMILYLVCAAGLGAGWGTAVALLFLLNPTTVLYENLLYYTHPEAVLLLMALVCAARWLDSDRTRWLFAFWSVLLALALVRSLFHPLFFLLLAMGGAWGVRRCWPGSGRARRFLTACLPALAVLVLVCAKNQAVYGFFGTSSWQGMSLWLKVNGYDPDQLEAWYAEGVISLAAVRAEYDPFEPIEWYAGIAAVDAAACHHPADCTPRRSSGLPNFNHAGYAALSQQLSRDAQALIRRDPKTFLFYTLGAYSLSLWYASDAVHGLFDPNLEHLERRERYYRDLFLRFLGGHNKYSDPLLWVRTVVLTLCFVLVYGTVLVACWRRAGPWAILGLVCLVVHVWVLGVSAVVEFGENNRFRYPVDAVFLVMAACAVRCGIGWLRALHSTRVS